MTTKNSKPREFASLDLLAAVSELQSLVGSRVKKIYQKENYFYIALYTGETKALFIGPDRIHLTNYKIPFPTQPPSFCMLLRKKLSGATLRKIIQHDFDRVVELHFSGKEKQILIAELFGDGNLILANEDYKISLPLHVQKWKHRIIKPGEKYKYPPEGTNPLEITESNFNTLIQKSETDVVRTLALKLGFGGTYAEEICERAKVEKGLDGISANLSQLKSLFKAVQAVIAESKEIKNAIILFEEGEPVDFSPIKLKKFKGETKKYQTFSEACDEFYVKFQIEDAAKIKTNQVDKYERILEAQKTTLEKLKLEIPEFKKKGDDLSMKQDFKQAQKFYEKYKKDKKKIDGLIEAIEDTKKKMKEAESIEFKEEAPKKKVEEKKEWYEKFRWFKSSDGFLVIGGKDATSNEIVVKKHTEPHDIVFHADITGAPFCIIKTNGKDVPETTLEETAQFAASYSKAWPRGLGTVDVYYVKPDQVSKEAPAGEHIGKGAFMIYGKKTYFRNVVLRIAVGLDANANVISGPESSVRERTVDYLLISPGREKAGELAKKLKAKFLKKAPESFQKKIHKIQNSDLQKFIPAGKGKIVMK